MEIIVPFIVVAIIILQIYFFCKNFRRMREYKEIFAENESWTLTKDSATGFVNGIIGDGNEVFNSIKDSINQYLRNSVGNVIDFQLLKDAIDRHCDAVENDINSLTPVPLYCGLAGTMAGVIVGLFSLLLTGSIGDLLSSGSGDFGMAATGVTDLLAGVAWAMFASICGICLTTVSSVLFNKNYKLVGEKGKNTFLVWLQATLLPATPSDMSDALTNLVKNLNRFNSTFAQNTTELRGALLHVNETYKIQADIIKSVHDMDVMKMATANVSVLEELKGCTDKLEKFNQYLNDIHGYTDAIHKFTALFESEANRLHVLEEIQQFFMRHKAEIAKETGEADVELKKALDEIRESANNGALELNNALIIQSEQFKKIIKDEIDSFEKFSSDMKAMFSAQINQFPTLENKLAEISRIPELLDRLISKIEKSNKSLASNINAEIGKAVDEIKASQGNGTWKEPEQSSRFIPKWIKWTIVISLIVIAVACLSNTVLNMFFNNKNLTEQTQEQEIISDTLATDTVSITTVKSFNANQPKQQ